MAEEGSFELARAIGRPRSVLVVGGPFGAAAAIARDKGARVAEADIENDEPARSLGEHRFDLVIFGPELLRTRDPVGTLERFAAFLEDGGHLIVSLPSGAAPTSPPEISRLVERAGLEFLWMARSSLVVARKTPASRKLSLTVGMISMNEEAAVGPVIDDIRKEAPGAEVLLVDSSTDRTPRIAEERGARVVRQIPPRGYGPAMDRLLYEARTDVLVTMDCDGTYPADRIPAFQRLIEDGADLVNGTRTRHRPQTMPFANFVANRVFAATAKVLHGIRTTDVHSGMRAYRTSLLRGLDLDPNGPALPVDLLVVPARLGYRIIEVEIPYADRIGNTTLHRFDSTVWTFRRLLRSTLGKRARHDRIRVM